MAESSPKEAEILNFYQYITKSQIDDQSKKILGQATITRVAISTREGIWQIYLDLPAIVRKKQFNLLAGEIIADITGLKALHFKPRYRMEKIELKDLIANYWEDICLTVLETVPALNGWLNSAQWSTEDNRIMVKIKNELGLGILESKGVDRLIARILAEEFALKAEVVFSLNEETANEDILAKYEEQEQKYADALLESVKEEKAKPAGKAPDPKATGGVVLGKAIKGEPVLIRDIVEEEKNLIIQGYIFNVDIRELKSGRKLITFDISDLTDSITVKIFDEEKGTLDKNPALKKGQWLRIRGPVQQDRYSQELCLMAYDINMAEFIGRTDDAEEKRVELHLHTKMSTMDGVSGASELIKRALAWGHKAIAITDHGVAQAYPEADDVGRNEDIKIIYGLEGYLVDDGNPIIINAPAKTLTEEEYVVFDLETTGFSPGVNEIIEIGAVKVKEGQIIDRFSTFVRPLRPIPQEIQQLTGITPDLVSEAPLIEDVIGQFTEFYGEATLVAHNAQFDTGFLRINIGRHLQRSLTNPVLDTLGLARSLLPGLKNHKLNTLSEHFKVSLENHHRAVDDAEATTHILSNLLELAAEAGVETLPEINNLTKNINLDKLKSNHIILLVKNQTGLQNLYHLISDSNLKYYHRTPRIPKSELMKKREGIIVGSACEAGQLFRAILDGAGDDKIEAIAEFYDFLEIQPRGNNQFLVANGQVANEEGLLNINRQIVALGEKLNKPVVATGDVHFLDPEDEVYRRILMAGKGFEDADNQAPLYLKTTGEMLEEFAYLGEDKAREVVITNPNAIADQVDELIPMPDGLFPPEIDGAEEQIINMTNSKAREIYGDPLPEIVQKRVDKELNSIITHGFAVLYLIAQKLVKKSNDDGYLVGSRGSVGSSFVANMTGITEVNSLPPHYVCPNCKHSEFITDGSYGSGADLPDKDCPECGTKYKKNGHDIPFEVFLGFKGDKVPDIDLNFSGDYQPRAHKFTEELFGVGYVFRAGTIGTIASKTAYGFVKNYLDDKNQVRRNAEINRLVDGCTGVKRTTGQHPGGVMVVPRDMDIHDFSPLQHPADDPKSDIITTHFDYHSISGRIVKLDILGHDDPTVIKMLEDLTGIDAKTIPLDEPKTMSLFSGTEALGVTPEDIRSNMGTYAIPEFGTKFVRQMLEDTKPKTFSELVRISGFSHGTDVWLNNAQDLIREGTCQLSDAISTRDDIMLTLLHYGLEPGRAFKIMESVRKGKGLKPEDEEEMRANKVPEWFIGSCKKIKYMFPKAHAVAYVMMAFRIAWFKVNRPEAFYATYFTVRADEFDADLIVQGKEAVLNKILEIEKKGNDASTKEKNLLTILEVAVEMYARGFKLLRVDLNKSDATKFLIAEEGLLPPLASLQGVGDNAAKNIVAARNEAPFTSIEDLRVRSKISKTVIEVMEHHGCLRGMSETDQLQLFR